MSVVERLTEQECYLWAILSDPSGLDQAEFLWVDAEHQEPTGEVDEDGNLLLDSEGEPVKKHTYCFRAWPFQWAWWRCEEPKQIDQCGRSVGKSLSIKVRGFAFAFLKPGSEMLLTAPEGNHLDAITDLIETQILNTRLSREMLVSSRSRIKHRPFHVNFANGARLMGRIPQRDGRGIKGQHPVWLELDEAQDYPDKGWIEIAETLKRASGGIWRSHGVTRGLRDYFYKFTQPQSGWKVHRFTAFHRPTWTEEEREAAMKQYGSRENPDYRRNLLGLHGDSQNPLFVLHRLAKCVDYDLSSDYNASEFTYLRLNNEMVVDHDDQILPLLDLPSSHTAKYKNFWIGMDVGYTNHPSEILVFAEVPNKDMGPTLKLVTRVKLERIRNGHQVQVMLYLMDFYKPLAFSMDKTGVGLPLFQDLQDAARKDRVLKGYLEKIKGYNFSSNIVVDFDDSIDYDPDLQDESEIYMRKNVLEYASDRLRGLVDERRLQLPYTPEGGEDVVAEFQGQTWSYDNNTMTTSGKKKSYSAGKFHALDAAKMAVLGYQQHGIEKALKQDKFVPIQDVFIY